MKVKQFTVSPFWDAGAKKEDGTSRIMITVNLKGQQFRVTVKLRSTKSDFTKAISGKGGSDEAKELRKEINNYILKAESILDRIPNCTKDTFIRFFKSENNLSLSSKTCVFTFFIAKRDRLKSENRFGMSGLAKDAYYALRNYKMYLKDGLLSEQRTALKNKNPNYIEPSVEMYFEDITIDFLKAYRAYLLNVRKISDSTAGMYLRGLRGLYNECVNDGILPRLDDLVNPFKKVSLSWTSKSKNVLYPEHIKALWEYQPIGIMECRAKAFFFFSYLCNGMNFADIGRLKYSNIKGNVLTFKRRKTKDTKKNGKEIKLYLHEEARNIISEWGTKDGKLDDFIFSMFNNCNSELHLHNTILMYKARANDTLNKIGRKLNFDVSLNIQLARHSFATKLKLNGTPISFISEAMGHSDIQVTEHYIKSLPDENLKVMSDSLLSFD